MFTPNGLPVKNIEKVMLLAMWANSLSEEKITQKSTDKFIFAGLGKPTYPINKNTIISYQNYWQKMNKLAEQWFVDPEKLSESAAIGYGDPRSDKEPKEIMAKAMSHWYQANIQPENILFTVGGISALHIIFETLNSIYENIHQYRVITPFPHYSAYANNPNHCLHPVHVMNSPGYQLMASELQKSITEAYELAKSDNKTPKAVLICNPSNPLSTVINKDELIKIADCLRNYPELHIILDEAYAEMSYVDMPSFFNVAPDLIPRMIVLRSATKALSAAGERMAILMAFDRELMNQMVNKSVSYYVHAPRSAQFSYANTMANFTENDRLLLADFYKNKVNYVMDRIKDMGAAMPNAEYKIEATFYALADFSDLFGMEMPEESKRVFKDAPTIETDEHLAYYLLFEDLLMIAPLSYFGLERNSGIIRITSSGSEKELSELMNRLENRLFLARTQKKQILLDKINENLLKLPTQNLNLHNEISEEVNFLTHKNDNCLKLKETNGLLTKIHNKLKDMLSLPVDSVI